MFLNTRIGHILVGVHFVTATIAQDESTEKEHELAEQRELEKEQVENRHELETEKTNLE